MLNMHNIHFDYANIPILRNINLSIQPGTLIHIRGDNGSGKTTLLKLLAGLIPPTDGEIFYVNQNIQHDLYTYQQQICYVGHKSGVHQRLTVAEHCSLEAKYYPQAPALDVILQQANFVALKHTLNGLLSFGQRRRVGLSRLLMSQAIIWLLDEPFNGLDVHSIDLLMNWIHNHLQKNGMVILTSHQPLPNASFCHIEYIL